ncbi:MAG: hypothetical protein ACD_79C00746G0002 [uncultured bacterium]|nr:MAG: hypothetical protein ACD_79C00746G0002 [uncultured bacterium]
MKHLLNTLISEKFNIAISNFKIKQKSPESYSLPAAEINFSHVLELIQNNPVLLFLDFDGTLTPIVNDANKPQLSSEMKSVLQKLSEMPHVKVAIITGRSIKDIKSRVKIKNLIYSGNHGLEIKGDNLNFKYPIQSSYKQNLKYIYSSLNQKLNSINGVLIQNKNLTLSLHYRMVEKKDTAFVKKIFYETVKKADKRFIKILKGKKVLDIRPNIFWSKGDAVQYLINNYKSDPAFIKAVPVFFGDDITDEFVFKRLQKNGITVRIGKSKISQAKFYLNSPEELHQFLLVLQDLQKNKIPKKIKD